MYHLTAMWIIEDNPRVLLGDWMSFIRKFANDNNYFFLSKCALKTSCTPHNNDMSKTFLNSSLPCPKPTRLAESTKTMRLFCRSRRRQRLGCLFGQFDGWTSLQGVDSMLLVEYEQEHDRAQYQRRNGHDKGHVQTIIQIVQHLGSGFIKLSI